MKGLRFAAFVFAFIPAASVWAQQTTVPPTLFVPVGTILTVQVRDSLSSDRNRAGDGFRGMLQQPLVVDGWVVARPGQTVIGHVASAQKAGRAQGASRLGVELTELLLVDGQQLPVRTQLIQSYGPESRREDVGTIAAGAGIGTLIGVALGGGKGAAIGAATGGAAALAGVLSTRGRATEIQPETLLTFRLDAPLTISTARSVQAFLTVAPADYNSTPALRVPARSSTPPQRRSVFAPPIFYPRAYYAYPYPVVGPRIHVVVRGDRYRRR